METTPMPEIDVSFTLPDFKKAVPQVQTVMTLANATVHVNGDAVESVNRPIVKKTKIPPASQRPTVFDHALVQSLRG